MSRWTVLTLLILVPVLFLFGLVGLPISTTPHSTTGLQLGFSDRERSSYRPGDCLRTPIIKAGTLERWQEPPAAATILMVAEVGNQTYRTRGWGAGFGSPGLAWYDFYKDHPFAELDNVATWQLIPCPEQQPAPQESRTFDPVTGEVFYTFEDLERDVAVECTRIGNCRGVSVRTDSIGTDR